MNIGDVLGSGLLVIIAYGVMRQIEHWLHQHIFKVGWLVTKNFQTTTILYYTFFLPGVFLNQFVYWLTAGMLDVRADRDIKWPEKQDVGELKLDFIQLSKKANPMKVALISIAPLIVGLAFVLFVANNVFDIQTVLAESNDGTLASFATVLRTLTSSPDFWLWFYLLFTVSNTMNPDFSAFASWQRLVWIAVIALFPLFIIGVGDEIIGGAIAGPITTILNLLSSAFIIIVAFDIAAIIILAIIENTIEYVTGDSATFKNGKMIVMTRDEARTEREKERKRAISQREKARQTVRESGPPSVYKLSFPIPGAPGEEPVTQLASGILGLNETASSPAPDRPQREEPSVITSDDDSSRIKFNPSRSDDGDDDTLDEKSTDRSPTVESASNPRMPPDGDAGIEEASNKAARPTFSRPTTSPIDRTIKREISEAADTVAESSTKKASGSPRFGTKIRQETDEAEEKTDSDSIRSGSASSRFSSLSRSTSAPANSRFGSTGSRSTLLGEDDDADGDDDLNYEDVEDSP